jgi:electron transport complex protein RnfD
MAAAAVRWYALLIYRLQELFQIRRAGRVRGTMPEYKPQVNISISAIGRMWLIFACASLAVIQSSLSDSGASIILACCALCTAFLAELLMTYKSYGFEKIKDGSAAASALVFILLLPNQIHPAYAVLGTLFAMLVIKHSFGGLGSNWLNPGLGGFLFVRFSWPSAYNSALLASDHGIEFSVLDNTVSSFLNRTVFSIFGSELPFGYIDLLIPRSPGIIADRGLLALLAGTVIISAYRIARSWIPLVYMGFYGVLVFVFGDLQFMGDYFRGDLLFALLSG